MARLNLGSGATATITNVTGGNIVGSGPLSTVTTPNQITGGESSNVTWLSIPTNTSSTRHEMEFGANVALELTNSGSVAFSDNTSGTVAITKGPSNTLVSNLYDITAGSEDYFSITSTRTTADADDNVEQTYDIISAGVSVITGGAIGDLSGIVTPTIDPRYYTDTSTTPDTLYRVGTLQTGTPAPTTVDGVTTTIDFYSLKIETRAAVTNVTLGGIRLTAGPNEDRPLPDNGSNYTDNVLVQERPFDLTVTFPEDYGYAAVEFPNGTIRDTVVNSADAYNKLTNFFSITSNSDGDEQTFDIISASSSENISNEAISELKGLKRSGSDDRYYQLGGLIYRIGALQETDGTTKYYRLIEESNIIELDQIDLTAEDMLKVAVVKVGLAPFFFSYFVSGNDQTIIVNPEIQDYSQTAAIPDGTAVTNVKFNTGSLLSTNLLDITCTNVRQQGDIMNNILTESIFGPGTNRGEETVKAMLFYSSSDLYRTVNDAMFFNSDRVRLTSLTAGSASSKETMAYFNPTTATAADLEDKLYLLTVDDAFLGQSIIRTDFTSTDLTNELNRRKVTEGTLQNAQLNIPAFGPDQ